ncbi:MAG: pseudouridine synthase [Bacteroidales bacterium]|nr:pseudouridine synthase [Bacteroidales bacterium]
MENYKKDGESRNAGRPRRPRIGSSSSSERVSYSERRSTFSGDRKPSYGERRTYGDKPSFNSDRKPAYGERREGGARPYGDRKPSFGSDRKPAYGERRSYGDKPSFNSDRKPAYGERREGGARPYGDRKPSFGGDRKPAYNSDRKPSYGERRSFGDKPSFGERRPSFGKREGGSYGKPGYGPRKPFQKKPFDRAAQEGINRMISDRPQLDADMWSDNDHVNIPVKDEIRLNKFIANSGICSRREADNYILAGVVTVNGEVVTELGTKINVRTDDIRFNGERLRGEEKVYIVMNKPKGYVTTASDPHAEKTVMDLLKGCPTRVFAVGRLDKNTTGVLMFTNDGEIAEKLTHPSYDKKKIYQVSLDKDLKKEDFDKVMSGVTLTDGDVAADDLQYIDENDHRKLGIEIHSGKNRIVRRIFETLGYEVKALDRVYFAGLTKKGIKRGDWRYLTEGETNILKMGAYR